MDVFNLLNATLLWFVSPKCTDQFLLHYNFFDGDCLKMFISKWLGFTIIAASPLVKLPQLIKILRAKSGRGISFTSQLMELTAVSTSVAYGRAKLFPFSSYGESIFLSLQTSFIAFFTLFFNSKPPALAFIGVYGVIMAFLCSAAAPLQLIMLLQAAQVPVMAVGKLLQIIANYRNSSTGQLSVVTILLIAVGSVARVFTSIQETGDFMMVVTYIVASSLNTLMVIQIFYYWNNKVPTSPEKKQKAH